MRARTCPGPPTVAPPEGAGAATGCASKANIFPDAAERNCRWCPGTVITVDAWSCLRVQTKRHYAARSSNDHQVNSKPGEPARERRNRHEHVED